MTEELAEGWATATGRELFDFVRGVSFKKEDAKDKPADGDVAILRAGNLQDGRILLDDLVYVAKKFVAEDQQLRKGDLVIAMSSGSASVVGKVSVVESELQNVSYGAFCGLIRPRRPEFASWLRHYFQTQAYRQHISEQSAGVNINNLRAEHLLSLEIPLSPLAEQRRIVAKIEELTARSRAARAALAEVPTLLEQFRQSVLASAFRGDLTADWREKHPGTEPASVLLARIRDERRKRWEAKYPKKTYVEPDPVDEAELPELPEGWCWTTIEESCSAIVDCPHSTPAWTATGRICVRTTEFRPGVLDLQDAKFVSEATFQERISRLVPQEGDILYSREGGILGIAAIIPPNIELCLGQRMMLLRADRRVSAALLIIVDPENWTAG
jgi:type I restriction enzyme S subunit